jgi:DNA-binding transcriptional ArsR family regulator
MRRDVFQAIADPTRREIINLIAHKSLNLNAVAENFDVSRPAISKHIKILMECGLLVINQQGRERYCEAKLDKLNEVSDWVEQYRKFWNAKLDALENYLTELQLASAKAKKTSAKNPPSQDLLGKKKQSNRRASAGKKKK